MDERERRIGENEAFFRKLNENVEELNRTFATVSDHFSIVCECGQLSCVERIELTTAEYEKLRSDSTTFAVVPGHEFREVETVVDRTGRYWVVQKFVGEPAEVARETDPRT